MRNEDFGFKFRGSKLFQIQIYRDDYLGTKQTIRRYREGAVVVVSTVTFKICERHQGAIDV